MLFSKLSLFTIGCVLMDNALGDSFVYLADCGGVCFFNSSLVFRLQSLVKLFDSGFDCGADHAVAKILLLTYAHALQSGLMVSQNNSPPVSFYSNGVDYNT